MPRGSGPLVRALVMALLLGAPLAACAPGGPDGPPRAAPSGATTAPTVSSTAAPSSTPASATPAATAVANPTLGPLPDGVAPARPAALDQPPTLEGAKSVAAYFLLLFSYAYQSNDLTAWKSLSHAQCAFCSDVQSDIEKRAARGAHVTGGTVVVSDVKGTEVDVAHFFNIQATIRESGSKTVEATGAVTDDLAPGSTATDMVLLYESGAWTIRSVDHKPIDGK